MNTLESTTAQLEAVNAFFDEQAAISDRLVYVEDGDATAEGENKNADNNKNKELLAA
ncbi:hypothetical protein D3C87_1484960 [compost metagenome]